MNHGTLFSGEDRMAPSSARLGVGLLSMLKRPKARSSFHYSSLKSLKQTENSLVDGERHNQDTLTRWMRNFWKRPAAA